MSSTSPESRPTSAERRKRRLGLRAPLVGPARLMARLRSRLKVQSVQEYNERVIYTEVIFQAIAGAGAMSFISVFLVRLGAPNFLVGLYTSLPALVTIIAVLPMGTFVQRRRSLVATVCWSRIIWRGMIGAFALLPYLPAGIAPYVLVAARSLLGIPGAAINVAVTTIWGKVTTPQRRPRLLSTRAAIHGIFGAVVGLLAGQWLDWAPFPLNYQLLFLSALFAGVGSVLVMSRLKLPQVSQEEIKSRPKVPLRDYLPLIRATPAFRNFVLAAFVFRMGTSLPSALFPIYRVRVLGSTDSWIGILFTVQRVLSVFAYLALGRFATRAKFRRWLWLSSLGMALFPLTTAFVRTPTYLLIPSILGGTFSAGVDIFLTNTLLQVSPEEKRPTFVAVNTLLANVTAFAGPLLGTALAGATTIRAAFYVSTAMRVLGGLVFWRLGVGSERQEGAPAKT